MSTWRIACWPAKRRSISSCSTSTCPASTGSTGWCAFAGLLSPRAGGRHLGSRGGRHHLAGDAAGACRLHPQIAPARRNWPTRSAASWRGPPTCPKRSGSRGGTDTDHADRAPSSTGSPRSPRSRCAFSTCCARVSSNKQIAHEMQVGETTVKAHVSEILRKLNVYSRTQAVIEVAKLDASDMLKPRDGLTG